MSKEDKKETSKEIEAKIIRPIEKKKKTKKKVEKTTERVKQQTAVVTDKVKEAAKDVSETISDGIEEIKKETKEKPIWTNETINRVIIALIIVIIVFVIVKLFGLVFNVGSSLFGKNAWAIEQAELYVSGFSYGVKDEDLKCKITSHKKSNYIVECYLKSDALKTQWQSKKLYVGVIEYKNGDAGFCAPVSEKKEVKECLKK